MYGQTRGLGQVVKMIRMPELNARHSYRSLWIGRSRESGLDSFGVSAQSEQIENCCDLRPCDYAGALPIGDIQVGEKRDLLRKTAQNGADVWI
jgi:hypothetical protein